MTEPDYGDCAGCGMALSEDETYLCEDCADFYEMMGGDDDLPES